MTRTVRASIGIGVIPVLLLALTTGGTPLRADVRYSKADSDSLERKISSIVASSVVVRRENQRDRERTTPIAEREVNAYLRHGLREQIPAGLSEPTISIVGGGRLAAQAVVDLDAVRAQSSQSWLDPSAYLTGRLPVTATGVLRTTNGTGRFHFESATISGVSVPKSVLQSLITYYSRSPETPNGVSLDDAFDLPAGIREIRVEPGQALVIQ